MSLHFQVDIAFDIKDDTADIISSGLQNIANDGLLTEEQSKYIPKLLTYLDPKSTDNSFYGMSFFYLKKHYRYTRQNKDVYKLTVQLRQVYTDDIFYEQGYPLLAWFAMISETAGFVGYFKEELAEHPKLLYFRNSEVLINDNPEHKFKLTDFDIKYRLTTIL